MKISKSFKIYIHIIVLSLLSQNLIGAEDFSKNVIIHEKPQIISELKFKDSNLQEVDNKIQKKRLIILQKLLEDIQIKENKNKIGKLEEVLIENKMRNQTKYFGRIKNLTPVIISNTNEKDIGKIILVRIKNCNRSTLFGIKENIEREAAA